MSKRSPDDVRPDPRARELALRAEVVEGDAFLEAESIGQYLSRQRELRGISARQLADMTRIPLRSIERLEAGHFDNDVDGFVRGFVRTVALALGLDPDDALVRMLAEPRGDAETGRPSSVLVGRSLVGLFALAVLALAFGIVRVVLEAERVAGAEVDAAPMIWRSDPVRALAEANAAQPVAGVDGKRSAGAASR